LRINGFEKSGHALGFDWAKFERNLSWEEQKHDFALFSYFRCMDVMPRRNQNGPAYQSCNLKGHTGPSLGENESTNFPGSTLTFSDFKLSDFLFLGNIFEKYVGEI